ncbi:MAG TPA: FAD-dependent oxidoreductase [Phycisphaerae bacterium]|nr:FAD-dependent oxidoreductase [Phycisphaerae bacterium]
MPAQANMSEQGARDVIVIGGGPAGLSAALYAARDRYNTLVVEKNNLPGGQILLTERIENYPGYRNVSGPDLIQQMREQVEAFGAEIVGGQEVTALARRDDGLIEVQTNDGEGAHAARAVILAPGSDYRQLGVPGEAEMRQATRVSYCATCDGAFYRDKHVLAVGGGNTAVEDTIYLASRFARKVTMIHRRREFRAQKVLVEELRELAKQKDIDIKLPYVLERIVPNAAKTDIDHVEIRNVETDAVENLKVDGVFMFVGMVPNTAFLKGVVKMNDAGYVACDCTTLKTSMPGVFVAGDCRQRAAMQLATACSDGVVAAMMLKDYFRDPGTWKATMAEDGIAEGW